MTAIDLRTCPTVTYWHVELDAHDIVFADGLAAESYLDTGNRAAFANGGRFVEQHPDFSPRHWADTCLKLAFDGPVVERAKAGVLRRAGALGYRITAEDDLHIRADGVRHDPVVLGDERLGFFLPNACASITLRSRAFVPAHINPASGDRRTLGLCVAKLQIDGEDIGLDNHSIFDDGWHKLEIHDAGARLRWTGAAVTLAPGTRLVVIDLAGRGYYWDEPAANVVTLFG